MKFFFHLIDSYFNESNVKRTVTKKRLSQVSNGRDGVFKLLQIVSDCSWVTHCTVIYWEGLDCTCWCFTDQTATCLNYTTQNNLWAVFHLLCDIGWHLHLCEYIYPLCQRASPAPNKGVEGFSKCVTEKKTTNKKNNRNFFRLAHWPTTVISVTPLAYR